MSAGQKATSRHIFQREHNMQNEPFAIKPVQPLIQFEDLLRGLGSTRAQALVFTKNLPSQLARIYARGKSTGDMKVLGESAQTPGSPSPAVKTIPQDYQLNQQQIQAASPEAVIEGKEARLPLLVEQAMKLVREVERKKSPE